MTAYIITMNVCYCSIARHTFNASSGFAMAAIFKFLNLIAGLTIVIPLINNNIIMHCLTITILALFLFTSKQGEDYNGGGNGYFFHNTQNIYKALNGKVWQLGIYVNNC